MDETVMIMFKKRLDAQFYLAMFFPKKLFFPIKINDKKLFIIVDVFPFYKD